MCPAEPVLTTAYEPFARQPAWLALGHYHPTPLTADYQGEADDPDFYLAADGAQHPLSELIATLAAWQQADGRQRARLACRYPARYHWLASVLDDPARRGLTAKALHCQELEDWLITLNAGGVSLIFPGAYLNSPSSVFGHTFLRLDRNASGATTAPPSSLLDYTINFSADVAQKDNELFFAWKGLFGGYPGIFSVLPYHARVKEYSDMESRDIWEYTLNLTPEETRQMLRHVWEVQHVRFDYYFMDENCSYRSLALLDVARPTLELRKQMALWVLPADAVRSLVNNHLVSQVNWRPSAASLLRQHARQLDKNGQTLALRLANPANADADEASIPIKQRIQQASASPAVLELAYEALRYQTISADPEVRKLQNPLALGLLQARSRLPGISGFSAPPTPDIRPDQGHHARRLSTEFGYQNGAAYGGVEYRPLYHDLTDPAAGYQQGAAVSFLDTSLRFYERGDVQLEQIEALNITSLTPRDAFIHPSSWSVRLGAQRQQMANGRPLIGYLSGEWGQSWAPASGHLLYGLLDAEVIAGGSLASVIDPGLGPRTGWLYQDILGGQGQLDFSLHCYLINPEGCLGRLKLEHTFNIALDHSLRMRASREGGLGSYGNLLSISYQYYF